MQELAEQIATKIQLEIVAIQETRWSGNSLIKRNNYSLYYRASNTVGQAYSGFIVKKKALKYILGFEPYNEQIYKDQR
jgi:exonuclease III